MTSKQDPSDQVKFLVACIGHTTNGRPDFAQVANDLAIVSKAAAQKRYERMLKAHGINTKGGAATSGNTTPDKAPATPNKRKAKAPTATGSATKKTKATPTKKESDDDDEKPAKARGKVKAEDDAASSSSLTDPPSDSDKSMKDEC
ncbi:hypothetical protein G7046_g4434 [Stylonectria norvegica]|nr:hypothetical protein G7046_g4434 [Stylonectria norvegica]